MLVWSPLFSLGGGVRLFASLIPALARQPGISRVIVPYLPDRLPGHRAGTPLPAWLTAPGVQAIALTPPRLDRFTRWQPPTHPPGRAISAVQGYARRKLLPAIWEQWTAAQLQRLTTQTAPDLLYAFWPHMAAFPALTRPDGRPLPVVCTYQDATLLDFPEIMGGAAAAAERDRARDWLTRSAVVVLSSAAVRDRLTGYWLPRWNVAAAPLRVIHHNIMPLGDPAPPTAPPFPALPPGYLLYPANLNVHKNHAGLFMAYADWNHRADHRLVLVGDSTDLLAAPDPLRRSHYWQHDRLIGLLERLDLRPDRDFHALGYVTDAAVSTLVHGAYALVIPTLSEGGGSYPFEEACSAGIPIVCADIPMLREHAAARTAQPIWFDPHSAADVRRALDALVRDYPAHRQAARAAMTDPRPTWDAIAGQYAEVMKKVTSDEG